MYNCLSGSKLDKALVLGAWLISVVTTLFYLPFTKGSEKGCMNNFPKAMIKVNFVNHNYCNNVISMQHLDTHFRLRIRIHVSLC